MNDPITTEIQNIINQQLPAQVGEVLKRRLAEVEVLERELSGCKTLITTLRGRVEVLEKEARVISNLEEREKVLALGLAGLEKERQELAIQEAVSGAQYKLVNEMLDRNERIVLAVFGNNKFKYHECETETRQQALPPGGSYPQMHQLQDSRQRTIEREG